MEGDVPADSAVMSEEKFGPVLPIILFTDIDEVMATINEQPKLLALYIWSTDRSACERKTISTSQPPLWRRELFRRW
jgi:aldehyde dehydrogenase (NAD+)